MACDLVGRDHEVEMLTQLVAQARTGGNGALIVSGAAGIGKTALLDCAAAHADDMNVLRATGLEAESEAPYSGIHELISPILHYTDALPDSLSDSLEIALGFAEGRPVERFAPAAAVLLLLAEASDQDGPILGIVDDAHWLDSASAETLAFVARRLAASDVALLFAVRTGERRSFPDRGLEKLELAPLGPEESRLVLADAGVDLTTSVASAILDCAAGNPLALRELPRRWRSVDWVGVEGADAPIPMDRALAEAFGSTVRLLPDSTRAALLLAATSRDGDMALLMPALTATGLTPEDLDAAMEQDLIHVSRGRVMFSHPLLRSAVYSLSSLVDRRAAHASLADALDPARHVESHAWHRAEAAAGPDDDAAEQLAMAATHAMKHGAPAASGAALERASHLTTDRALGHRYLFRAAEAWWNAGNARNASRIVDELAAEKHQPGLHRDLQQMAARLKVWQGRPGEGASALAEFAAAIADDHPAQAAMVLSEATMACFMSGEVRRARVLAQRAVDLAVDQGSPVRLATEAALYQAMTLMGDGRRVKPDAKDVVRALCESAPLLGATHTQAWYTLFMAEEYDLARRLLELASAEARRTGNVITLPVLLASRSLLEYNLGRLATAASVAQESYEIAAATGQITMLTLSSALLGRAEAMVGDEDGARRHLGEAAGWAGKFGAESIDAYVGTGIGSLELALGRPDKAVELLQQVGSMMARQGAIEPFAVPWAPDLIEAHVRAGRMDEAMARLDEFSAQEGYTVAPTWFGASLARCRGLLCPPDDIDRTFAESMAWHDRSSNRFERARTELCWGERLRRDGRRLEARPHLTEAMNGFEVSGARLWLKRARRELAATGQRLPAAPVAEPVRLTPQEFQVAALVAEGATNREVAANLFVSAKTVEYHLRKVFIKLGIRTRSQLAHRSATTGLPEPAMNPSADRNDGSEAERE